MWHSIASLVRNVTLGLMLAIATVGLADDAPATETLPPDLATRPGDDWSAFLGPRRNGISAERGFTFDWPATGPRIVWQAKLGTGYSAPAIARGRLYHFDRYGNEDRLICREAETGKEIWSVASPTGYDDMLGYNNGPRCSPVVDGNRVYTFSAEGRLRCVDATTGKQVWEIDTQNRFNVVRNFFGVGSTPLVWGDLVIANIGGSPPGGPTDVYAARGAVQGNGTGVVAFDKRTGEVVWKASNELASYSSPVAADINGRPWCFVYARGGLVGLDPRTGKVDFEYPWRAPLLESAIASTPVVVGDEVFLSESYAVGSSLLKVRPGGFDIVWKDDRQTRDKSLLLHWNTPVYHEGFLYGSSGRHASNAELRCIEWKTGKVRWSQPALGRASLTYADGHFICLAENGTIHVLRASPNAYEPVRSIELRDDADIDLLTPPAWTAPVIARGLLYVRGDDRLVCLDLRGK
jgi:outer membrane protein assembly factor BamB